MNQEADKLKKMVDTIIDRFNLKSLWVNDNIAADIIGCSPQTLRNGRSTRKLLMPYTKFNRSVRYSLYDLAEFMERHRVSVNEELG